MTAAYIDVVHVRNDSVVFLTCDVADLPRPIPLPTRFWFKDGQIVSSMQYGASAEIDELFLMENPILTIGVFDFPAFQVLLDGTTVLFTGFSNISSPELGMIAPGTTLEEARKMLLNIFLGNWTCLVNNSLGSSSVEYILSGNGM